jgi:hypothetical protein
MARADCDGSNILKKGLPSFFFVRGPCDNFFNVVFFPFVNKKKARCLKKVGTKKGGSPFLTTQKEE